MRYWLKVQPKFLDVEEVKERMEENKLAKIVQYVGFGQRKFLRQPSKGNITIVEELEL